MKPSNSQTEYALIDRSTIEQSVAELRVAFDQLRLGVERLERVLASPVASSAPMMCDVITATSKVFCPPRAWLTTQCRARQFVDPRHAAWALLREQGCMFTEIARRWQAESGWLPTHGAIINGVNRAKALEDTNKLFRERIGAARKLAAEQTKNQ